MHERILSPAQLVVLARLKGLPELDGFYLAGGTSLALRHGHRRSVDFDFFSPGRFDDRALLAAIDARFPRVERLSSGAQTVYVRLEDVTTCFFRLPYPLLEPTERTRWGVGLASDRDLAAMKLEAIAGRGSRKDFVDLRLLCRTLTLDEVFDLFDRKYGTRRIDRYHRIRALAYFDDAEQQPMPDMQIPFDWDEAKGFFESEAQRILASAVESGGGDLEPA